VSFNLGDGSSSLALYQWEATAHDAGVSPEGSGFRGVSFHFIVSSREAVDEVMRPAVVAGGSVVKEAAASPFGYFGYFSDQTATSERSPLAPEQRAVVPRKRHDWHGEWNSTVVPTAAEDHPQSTWRPPASAPAGAAGPTHPLRLDPQRQVAMHPGLVAGACLST
jgi:hypothetical protein